MRPDLILGAMLGVHGLVLCAPTVAHVASEKAAGTDQPVATTAAMAPAEPQRFPRRRAAAVHRAPLVLTGGVLVDGTGAAPIPDAVVVVRGDRIVAVGRRGDIEVPFSATVLDARGGTILPGVFNAHVHSGYATNRAAAWGHAGVTTVRDLCGPAQYSLVDAISRVTGNARILAAGPFITVPGGYPIVPWGVSNAVPVTTAAEAAAAADWLIDQGADVIKIAIETGADFGRAIPTISLDQAAAIVAAAHARGIPVSAHVTVSADLPRALDAGIDDIAHMVVDDPSSALLERVVRQGVAWVPTLELWHVVGYGHEPRAVANLRRFVAAGGTVALGTDYNGYDAPFQLGMPIIEMELMQEAGMSPMQIIVAATKNSARVCNLDSELGTVEVGKIADLIVVRGDPLADIHALAGVQLVVRSGVVIRNEGLGD